MHALVTNPPGASRPDVSQPEAHRRRRASRPAPSHTPPQMVLDAALPAGLPAAALPVVALWEATMAARRWAGLAIDALVLGAEALAVCWAAGMAYDAARLLLHG